MAETDKEQRERVQAERDLLLKAVQHIIWLTGNQHDAPSAVIDWIATTAKNAANKAQNLPG